MRDRYHNDLAKIVDRVLELFDLVEVAITQATEALLDQDRVAAEDVITRDASVDAVCRDIEAAAIDVQVRQQPVASDLRLLLAVQRIVSDLERSGDLAKNIAKQARRRYPDVVVPEPMRETVVAMGAAAADLIRKAAEVFVNQDAALARQIESEDDHMDALHRSLLAQVISSNRSDPVETTVDLTLIGRFYERFADHAVAIGRQVIYLSTGELT
ncbi:MAG: phosphate signaling complex protein PhoU [Marmoricola sp.]|jgi:phosphate transport system protein